MAVQNLLLLLEERAPRRAVLRHLPQRRRRCSPSSACPTGCCRSAPVAMGHRADDRAYPADRRPTRPTARRPPRSSHHCRLDGSYGRRQWHRTDPAGRLPGARRPARTSWPTSARRAGPATSTAATPAPTAAAPSSDERRRRDRRRGARVHDRRVRRARRPVPFVAAIVDCDGTSVRGNIINVEPDPEHVSSGMKVRLATYLGRHRRRRHRGHRLRLRADQH